MPQLDSSTYVPQLFWLIVCFFSLIIFSAKVTLPRLRNVFNSRFEQIEGAEIKAKELQNLTQVLKAQRQKQLDEARQYAHHQIMELTQLLNKENMKAKQNLNQELKHRYRDFQAKLHHSEVVLLPEMHTVAHEISAIILNKIVSDHTLTEKKAVGWKPIMGSPVEIAQQKT